MTTSISQAACAASPAHPRFVPTLTEVIEVPAPTPAPSPAVPGVAPSPVPPLLDASQLDADALRDEIVHRVVQRVQLDLAHRLPRVVHELVAAHVDLLLPLLRDEIQATVSQAVDDALAREL